MHRYILILLGGCSVATGAEAPEPPPTGPTVITCPLGDPELMRDCRIVDLPVDGTTRRFELCQVDSGYQIERKGANIDQRGLCEDRQHYVIPVGCVTWTTHPDFWTPNHIDGCRHLQVAVRCTNCG